MLPLSYNNNALQYIIRMFYNGSLNWELENADISFLTWSKQEEFLNATLNNVLLNKYPMKSEFIKIFLKKLIGYLENGQEVHDDLYKYLCMNMKNYSEKTYHRHYVIGNELRNIISLRETNNMVLNGTTGMRTWEAALLLADWALCYKKIFKNKKILELGSGVGFTGITLAKYCEPETVMLTDCHDDVLSTLEHNIIINFNCLCRRNIVNGVIFEDKNVNIGVMKMDWTNLANVSYDFTPDVIIGADIIYDPLILEPLCNVLKGFVNKKKDTETYIAGVIRNEKTYEMFLDKLVSANFAYEKIDQKENVFIDWNRHIQRFLLKVSL